MLFMRITLGNTQFRRPFIRIRMDQIDWNQLRAFLETAEAGSLSAAARRLGLTQPTLGRQVAAIERSLNIALFERVGKRMVLTATGRVLLEQARTMGAAAQAIGLTAAGHSQAAEGVVSISASEVVAAHLLPRMLQRLRREAPGVVVEVIASDSLSDLQRREADIAIRHVRPEQPELIGRLIREASASFYATPSWVAAHGHPRTVADALQHEFVGADRAGQYLGYLHALGLPLKESQFRCYCDNSATHWELVRQGLGIGAMMDDIALRTPGVVRVLDDVPLVRFPIWLVTHRELHTARRIRIVYDLLAEAMLEAGSQS